MNRERAIGFRAGSPFRRRATPILSVMLASSVSAILPFVAQSPVLPPFGLLMLLAWRLLLPELWPLWIGIPLGAFDDIMTGQPLGTGIALWSIVLMGIERIDSQMVWRDYWHDWLVVASGVAFYLGGALVISYLGGSSTALHLILPQLLWSILSYPFLTHIVTRLDRWRAR